MDSQLKEEDVRSRCDIGAGKACICTVHAACVINTAMGSIKRYEISV